MYVISYDIDSDKIRNRMAKTLLDYGHRVQYSVFECDLNAQLYKELYAKMLDLVTGDIHGSVRIYKLCGKCAEKVLVIGEEKPVPSEKDDLIII